MKQILYSISIILLVVSCGQNNDHKHETDHKHHEKHEHKQHTDSNKSNIHMHQHSSFDELVANFESADRNEWQKPNEVINLLGDIKNKTIGDIGAGTGYFSFPLAQKGANVVAIDVDQRFLDFINDKKVTNSFNYVTTRLSEYDNPKLANEEFDALIIVNTYHHFNDKFDYMSKCKKGLKPNGKLMIVDFKKQETPYGPPVEHKIHESEVVADLKKAGFTQFNIDTILLNYQYIIIAE